MKNINPYLLISGIALFLFIPFLGSVHLFDWDEVNFAESAREMLVSGEYFKVQINYRPFWEKPPLFIWMQAFSMKIFGVNEFAARFPNVVCGLFTLLTIFHLGKRYFSPRVGWLWVLCFIGSFTPHIYFKSGIIDPWFNYFIFMCLVLVAEAVNLGKKQRKKYYILAGAFIGLALLTKGPVAIIVAGLCIVVFLVYRGFKFFFDLWDVLLFTLSCLLVSFVWYGTEILNNGFWFISEFITYQKELASESVATHGQPWYYHPVVILLGCFPASIVAFRAIGERLTWEEKQKYFRQWMEILFWVVLILFSIVKTKIVHYSSLCYLPLTFIAALAMENTLNLRIQFRRLVGNFLLFFGIVLGAAFMAIPLIGIVPALKNKLIGSMNDPFAVANFNRDVYWSGLEILPGIILIAASIYAFIAFRRMKLQKGYIAVFTGGMLSIQLFLLMAVPKIEQYTQGGAISFFETLKGKDVYVETLGYKSYAQYYYTEILPPGDTLSFGKYKMEHAGEYQEIPSRDRPAMLFRDWLISGDIDKDAYFSCKINNAEAFRSVSTLEEIGHDGGFVFFKRKR